MAFRYLNTIVPLNPSQKPSHSQNIPDRRRKHFFHEPNITICFPVAFFALRHPGIFNPFDKLKMLNRKCGFMWARIIQLLVLLPNPVRLYYSFSGVSRPSMSCSIKQVVINWYSLSLHIPNQKLEKVRTEK